MDFNVEILKYPTADDWLLCKQCTLNTVGKNTTKLPTDEWKHKLLLSEHSPIRTLNFCIKMIIPYYVSVHFCRHFTGVTHFVQSQRNDRQNNYDRTKAPQDEQTHFQQDSVLQVWGQPEIPIFRQYQSKQLQKKQKQK